MTFHNARRSMRFTLMTCWAIVASMGTVALTADTRTAYLRAHDWAREHPMPNISLAGFAAYPPKVRVQIYSHLSSETKARLWREHFRELLQNNAGFTSAQIAFVHHAMEAVDANLSGQIVPDSDELCRQVAKLFPLASQRLMFKPNGLGLSTKPEFQLRASVLSLRERIISSFTSHAADVICNCSGLGGCECGLGLSDLCSADPNMGEGQVDKSCIDEGNTCGCAWNQHECTGFCCKLEDGLCQPTYNS